jgi:hypothetical protein
MSSASKEKITCPKCQHQQKFVIWKSINVTLDPKLKEDLISGKLTGFVCERCGHTANVDYGTLYHDMENALLIQLCHGEQKEDFSALGEMFQHYRIRVVSSRNQLLEKIFIFDAGLDDRMVEFFKLFLLAMMSKQGKEAKELLFNGLSEKEGERTISFTAFMDEGQTGVSVPWMQYEAAAAKYACILPDPKTEEGKWLQVDGAYVTALNWEE